MAAMAVAKRETAVMLAPGDASTSNTIGSMGSTRSRATAR